MNNPRLFGLFCVFAVTLVSTLACNHDGSSSGEQLPGSIALTVNESMGSKCVPDTSLLEGATVTAQDTNGFFKDVSIQTDNVGYAKLELEPGIYDVLIEAVGHESVTVEDQQVFSDTETDVGDVSLREDDKPIVFNQDRAVLLAYMSSYAYAPRNWLIGDFGNPDFKLPKLDSGNPEDEEDKPDQYVENANFKLTTLDKDYTDCWERAGFLTASNIEDNFLFDKGGDVFIANTVTVEKPGFVKTDREDIVVSFRGTDTTGNGDVLTDLGIRKVSWALRNCEGRLNGDATPPGCLGKEIGRAVARGFRAAYAEIQLELQNILQNLIFNKVTDTSKSRVYFTGHSMGCALAQLAALDLADYLVKVHGYERTNIIMYGIGCPRNITENLVERADDPDTLELERNYQMIVPSSFAIIAKDDVASHKPGRDADLDVLFPAQYKHINQLIVLSTNIIDRSADPITFGKFAERYTEIGKTRIEPSNGAPFEGCRILIPNLSVPGTAYGKKGHDQLLYVKRLESLVDTSPLPNGSRNGFPAIGIDEVDTTPFLPGGWRSLLQWAGNRSPDSVMGPCDWVAQYKTFDGKEPTDAQNYECKAFISDSGFEWVVNGGGYPLGESLHTTCDNPRNDNAGTTNWICYVDGFDRIIRPCRSVPLPPSTGGIDPKPLSN